MSEKVATRERILRAALEVFAGKGYHGASVDDIVRASPTSKGAVYHHFTTKETMFFALVDDFAARLATRVAETIAEPHGALAEVHGRFAALVQGYLDEAVAEGSIPPLDTRIATLVGLGAVNEVVVEWLHTGGPDLARVVPELTRILLSSIRASREGPGSGPGT